MLVNVDVLLTLTIQSNLAKALPQIPSLEGRLPKVVAYK